MTDPMIDPMPDADFVVQIHSALAVRYGRRWRLEWMGLDMELVRTDWRRVLCEYADNPAAVLYALGNLPQQVPGAYDFRALCAAAPRPATRMLPAPVMSAEGKAVMRDLLARLTAPADQPPPFWADQVEARIARGEVVAHAVRRLAETARRPSKG